MTVKAITDLPEPDSPTRQTISPGLTVKLTFFDRVDTVGASRQGNAQIADFEDGLDGCGAHPSTTAVIPTEARRAEWRDLL